jgi:uncharacterized membrane protein affecting hemolysin expression
MVVVVVVVAVMVAVVVVVVAAAVVVVVVAVALWWHGHGLQAAPRAWQGRTLVRRDARRAGWTSKGT